MSTENIEGRKGTYDQETLDRLSDLHEAIVHVTQTALELGYKPPDSANFYTAVIDLAVEWEGQFWPRVEADEIDPGEWRELTSNFVIEKLESLREHCENWTDETHGAKRALLTIKQDDTVAFRDIGHREELQNVLRRACDQIRNPARLMHEGFSLHDTNGNEVGSVVFLDDAVLSRENASAPEDGSIQILCRPGSRDRLV